MEETRWISTGWLRRMLLLLLNVGLLHRLLLCLLLQLSHRLRGVLLRDSVHGMGCWLRRWMVRSCFALLRLRVTRLLETQVQSHTFRFPWFTGLPHILRNLKKITKFSKNQPITGFLLKRRTLITNMILFFVKGQTLQASITPFRVNNSPSVKSKLEFIHSLKFREAFNTWSISVVIYSKLLCTNLMHRLH